MENINKYINWRSISITDKLTKVSITIYSDTNYGFMILKSEPNKDQLELIKDLNLVVEKFNQQVGPDPKKDRLKGWIVKGLESSKWNANLRKTAEELKSKYEIHAVPVPEQQKKFPNELKQFDALKGLKTQLFDAPSDVKSAFNQVVKYFDGKAEHHRKLMQKEYEHPTTMADIINWDKSNNEGEYYESYDKVPKNYVLVQDEGFDPYKVPTLYFKDGTKVFEKGQRMDHEVVYKFNKDGIEYYTVSDAFVTMVFTAPSNVKKLKRNY